MFETLYLKKERGGEREIKKKRAATGGRIEGGAKQQWLQPRGAQERGTKGTETKGQLAVQGVAKRLFTGNSHDGSRPFTHYSSFLDTEQVLRTVRSPQSLNREVAGT